MEGLLSAADWCTADFANEIEWRELLADYSVVYQDTWSTLTRRAVAITPVACWVSIRQGAMGLLALWRHSSGQLKSAGGLPWREHAGKGIAADCLDPAGH